MYVVQYFTRIYYVYCNTCMMRIYHTYTLYSYYTYIHILYTYIGMMYNEAALRLIGNLEQLSPQEVNVYAKLKFNYIVACQVYGQMKRNQEHKADDIEFLLKRHPNLRVAYIDIVRPVRDGETSYYSVLVKHDPDSINNTNNKYGIKEVYRIKLAGNPVLGEGKPENQNHAVIFRLVDLSYVSYIICICIIYSIVYICVC